MAGSLSIYPRIVKAFPELKDEAQTKQQVERSTRMTTKIINKSSKKIIKAYCQVTERILRLCELHDFKASPFLEIFLETNDEWKWLKYRLFPNETKQHWSSKKMTDSFEYRKGEERIPLAEYEEETDPDVIKEHYPDMDKYEIRAILATMRLEFQREEVTIYLDCVEFAPNLFYQICTFRVKDFDDIPEEDMTKLEPIHGALCKIKAYEEYVKTGTVSIPMISRKDAFERYDRFFKPFSWDFEMRILLLQHDMMLTSKLVKAKEEEGEEEAFDPPTLAFAKTLILSLLQHPQYTGEIPTMTYDYGGQAICLSWNVDPGITIIANRERDDQGLYITSRKFGHKRLTVDEMDQFLSLGKEERNQVEWIKDIIECAK